MKLKYYLRGLGIGIIVTTIILMISFSKNDQTMTDDEVVERAIQLGMIMPDAESATETGAVEEEMNAEELLASVTSKAAMEKQDSEGEENTEAPQNTKEQPNTETVQNEGTEQSENTDIAESSEAEDAQTEGAYRLTIKKGDVCRTVCENLAANGVIDDAESLRKYLFEIGYASSISTGEYDVPYGLTMEEVAKVLQAGPIE